MQVVLAARGTGKTTYAKMLQNTEGTGCLRLVPFLPNEAHQPDTCTYEYFLEVLLDFMENKRSHFGRGDVLRYDSLICEEPSLRDNCFRLITQTINLVGSLPKLKLVIGTPRSMDDYFYKFALENNAMRWTRVLEDEDAKRYLGAETYYREYHAKFIEEF